MSDYHHDEFEVYGFEGTVIIECEMVLPVLRHVATDRFLKGSLEDGAAQAHAYFGRGEIERLAAERELTVLPEPRPCVPRARVLYVSGDFLAGVGEESPRGGGWQELAPQVWAASAPEEELRPLLEGWARRLVDASTDAFVHYLHSREEPLLATAERLAEFSLCATADAGLRASTYFRYGLAITESNTSERLQHLFEMFIQPEFPDWPWETFLEDLRRFKNTLRLREPAPPRVTTAKGAAESSGAAPRSYRDEEVKGTVEEILQEVERVSRIPAPPERAAAAFGAADIYRALFSVSEEAVNGVARRILENEVFRLTDGGEDLQVLAGEPAFYFQPSHAVLGGRASVTGWDFFKAVQSFASQTGRARWHGPITEWIKNKIEENSKSGSAAGQQAGTIYVPRRKSPAQNS